MSDIKKRLLPPFLVFAGIVCLSAYPLHLVWPSGWEWGMEGRQYLHMILVVYATLGVFLILAARDPGGNRSLLLFTAWSSVAHGVLMAGQAIPWTNTATWQETSRPCSFSVWGWLG